MRTRRVVERAVVIAGFCAGCGGAGGGDLHGEVPAFSGFSFDTGSVPSGSPVTIDLKATAMGTFAIDGSSGNPSNATLSLAGKVQLAGTAISTVPGASYNGPIQGAPDLSIQLAGKTKADLSTIGATSTLDTTVPASHLVTLPLATLLGVPAVTGNLDLEVTGGAVHAAYTATCAEADRFAGTLATSGNIVLSGTLDASVPLVGDMTFQIPAITIPFPSQSQVMSVVKKGDTGVCGDTSLDGGTSDGGPGTDGGPSGTDAGSSSDAAVPAPNTASVSIDGVAGNVSAVEVLQQFGTSAAPIAGAWAVVVSFTNANWVDGTDVLVDFFENGNCVDPPTQPTQYLVFRPMNATDQYLSSNGAGCGLTITETSSRGMGTFSGTTTGLNSPGTHQVNVQFDVALVATE